MNCYLCNSTDINLLQKGVRTNNNINVYKCNTCSLVFIEDYDVNYTENEMLKMDSSETMDEIDTARRFENYKNVLHNTRILDFGCGRGSFLHKLRENYTNALSALEPNTIFEKELKHYFPTYDNINNLPNDYFNYITLFHVLEHLKDPINILNMLFDKLYDNGKIIIEVPNHDDVFQTLYQLEEYKNFIYVPYHKFYFNYTTLKLLLEKTKFKIEYIKFEQRYDLNNHLYWLTKKQPNGHVIWPYLTSNEYKQKIETLGMADTLSAVVVK